jgi:hypothetical protein
VGPPGTDSFSDKLSSATMRAEPSFLPRLCCKVQVVEPSVPKSTICVTQKWVCSWMHMSTSRTQPQQRQASSLSRKALFCHRARSTLSTFLLLWSAQRLRQLTPRTSHRATYSQVIHVSTSHVTRFNTLTSFSLYTTNDIAQSTDVGQYRLENKHIWSGIEERKRR